VVDLTTFSKTILATEEAKNPGALERISLAKQRVQSVLDRETVSHQKTLEQKISDQGPRDQRVDPHLVGLAIKDLLNLNRLRIHHHPATSSHPWYANPGTSDASVSARLAELAPLYASVSGGGFGNHTGDALELIVYKCLHNIYASNARYPYQGTFHLDEPKTAAGRYRKTQPPTSIGPHATTKLADFLQFGHDQGPLCIECKNYREWIYPHHGVIADLIVKAAELGAVPVLVARRIHYSAKTNLLEPAGIIAHETYYQYFPADQTNLAAKVKHKRSLGFTDVVATEEPHPRTKNFFNSTLPTILPRMAARWAANRSTLLDYAHKQINLAQLYTAIGSQAGGKWQNYDTQADPNDRDDF
jgi:hypothetical protein